MEKNCYEILNLNPGLIAMAYDKDPVKKVVRDPSSRDRLVREAYERRLGELAKEYEKERENLLAKQNKEMELLEYALQVNTSLSKIDQIRNTIPKKKEEHQMQLKMLEADYKIKIDEVTYAYKQLATEGLRKIYEKKQKFQMERPYLNGDSAYDFFAISEQEVCSLNAFEANKIVKEVYERTVKSYESSLKKQDLDEEMRSEIEKKLSLAHEYYKKICDMDSRIKYKDELDLKEKEKKTEILEDLIREKCSKVDQYDPELIQTVNNSEKGPVKALKYVKAKDPATLYLPDSKNRHMTLTKTGELIFRNTPGGVESYISEYEVVRVINGKERIDRVYANLNLPQLGFDEIAGELVDPEYYNCVVNELLSEGVIRGSKYNKGYIGGVEKNENGKYQIILANKELDPDEKENLAAVMIYDEQQHNSPSIENEKESNEER